MCRERGNGFVFGGPERGKLQNPHGSESEPCGTRWYFCAASLRRGYHGLMLLGTCRGTSEPHGQIVSLRWICGH
jgi:hypothetical protein